MKGKLEDSITGNIREIELGYKVIEEVSGRIFQLLGGPTGYESFYIDSKYSDLEGMCKDGWCACGGTKGKYDKLIISAKEMTIALKPYMN